MNTKRLVKHRLVACMVALVFGFYFTVGQQELKSDSIPKIEVKQVEAQKALVIRTQVPTKEIGSKMGELYGKLFAFIGTNRISMVGAPFAVYYEYNPEGNTTFEVGVPISMATQGNDEISYKEFPLMKVVSSLYIGPYDKTATIYEALMNYIKDHNLQINGASWEIYVTDPMLEKNPNKFQTLIYFPIN